jgi:hypothetical protein
VESDASRKFALIFRNQEPPFGRSIVAGKGCKFLIEILEAQTESQGLTVIEKKFARLSDLFGR